MTATAGPSVHAQQVEKILKIALDNAATEVRLGSGSPPHVLIDGKLRPVGKVPLSAEDVQVLAAAILPPGGDPARFSFATALGTCSGSLVDIQGTKVLVLKPGAEPASMADGPLELDVQVDEKPKEESEAAGGDAFAMPQAAVGTVQIDKLLTAAIKNGVSDIHITAGLPPVFRHDGHMKPQATKVLTPDDTNGLMKAITP